MNHHTITLKLPPDPPTDRCMAIAHAVFSTLDAAGLAAVASVRVDELASDAELSQVLDTLSDRHP